MTVLAVIIALGAAVGALKLIWTVVRSFARTVSGVAELLASSRTEHDRLDAIEQQTKQLLRNGGSHLADRIADIAEGVEDLRRHDRDIDAELADLWKSVAVSCPLRRPGDPTPKRQTEVEK